MSETRETVMQKLLDAAGRALSSVPGGIDAADRAVHAYLALAQCNRPSAMASSAAFHFPAEPLAPKETP